MQCDYFDAGVCRSCTLMGVPYAVQLEDKWARCRATLAAAAPDLRWSEPFAGPAQGFRNKAKLVLGGVKGHPTLGILDEHGQGVDLGECGLYEPALSSALPHLADFVAASGLVPYDVPRRTGELKNLLVTVSPEGELMVRFVLRSEGQLGRLRRELPRLLDTLPQIVVASANLHPAHSATLEGEHEVHLTEQRTLPMRLDAVTLHLGVQSFFQTNTTVAQALYAQASAWVDEVQPTSVLDLFCGVGGFALHASAAGRRVRGAEISPEAITSARRSASEAGLDVTFDAADATTYAQEDADLAELVVVNPPRRGIGWELASWLDSSNVQHVIYSSCNVDSLAKDLAAMPSLRAMTARLFDMFPQTGHHEVLVLLTRG